MKTKILAQFCTVLFALLPSIAWAQQVPQPIIQGSQSWSVMAAGSATGVMYSDLIDTSGMATLQVSVQGAKVACGAYIDVFGSSKKPSSFSEMTILSVTNYQKVIGTGGAGAWSYLVGPLPPFIRLRMTGFNADVPNCGTVAIYATVHPMPMIATVVGALPEWDANYNWPVVVGGQSGLGPKSLKVELDGTLDTKSTTIGYGGSLSLGAETLVDVAATAMPNVAGTHSFTFYNNGPNPIFCGFANTVTTSTGIPIGSKQGATFDLTSAPQPLYCITTVLQVAGAGTRTVLSDAPDTFRIYGGGGGGGGSTSTDYAPGVPSNVSCSANVSCAITGLTASKTYQFGCNADFAYRVGSGTPTAVATDNDGKASVMYRQMLGTGITAFAFISSSGMTCKAGLVPDS